MRRIVPLVVVFLLVASARTAWAGGSWLEVTDGTRVRIGSWAVAYASVGSAVTMRGRFSSGAQAAVSEGPWYAYLSPQSEAGQRKAEPMLLGAVDIIHGGGYPYVASVTFVVPSVDAGYYAVQVCDLGCKQGVGDLIGGNIVLAATDSEARSLARALIFKWMHEADVYTIDNLQKRQEALRAELKQANHAVRAAETRADDATQRARDASEQAADSQASLEDAKQQRNLWRFVGGLALLASIVALAWAVSLRRRVRRLIPDSPEGLSLLQADERLRASTKQGL